MSQTKRVLVTGASGYLGFGLCKLAPSHWQVAATHLTQPLRSERVAAFHLDVRDGIAVGRLVDQIKPDVIIHLAARMQGDDMMAINAHGSHNVARAARRVSARLIHLSTDVIFDGEHAPYAEHDLPSPIFPYGESKAVAEKLVRDEYRQSVIVRNSLIYGFDPLDPRTRQTIDGGMPRLFTDEYRCPIFVDDLAAALIELAELDSAGVLNIAGPQRLSRYEFGVRLAQALHATPHLIPVPSSSSATPRPRDCTLDISRAQALLKTPLRRVDDVLASIRSLPTVSG